MKGSPFRITVIMYVTLLESIHKHQKLVRATTLGKMYGSTTYLERASSSAKHQHLRSS